MKVVGKSYASVSEMVRDTLDSDFADDFDRQLAEHGVSKALTIRRIHMGMTQADVASKMGCGQAKVSKLERTADLDLNLGDVVNYARAIGQGVHLAFMPAGPRATDRIRFHTDEIKQELSRLAEMAGDVDGVEKYAIDNVEKYVALIDDTLNKLPGLAVHEGSSLRVEVVAEHGDSTLNRPARPRSTTRLGRR